MRSVISLFVMLCTTVFTSSSASAAWFEFSPFVVASGMGQIDVLVPADANFYRNPALLPFSLDGRAMCGGNPRKLKLDDLSFTSWSDYVAVRVPLSGHTAIGNGGPARWSIAAGFQRYAVDYVGWSKYRDRENLVTLAVSRRGRFDFGLGVSAHFIRTTVTETEFSGPDVKNSGFSYDLGFFGRFPIVGQKPDGLPDQGFHLQAISGLALTEAGEPSKVGYYLQEHPHAWRAGLGMEAYFSVFRILVSSEVRRLIFYSDRPVSKMFGTEVEWRRAVTLRAGYALMDDDSSRLSSFGVSVSARGLIVLITQGGSRLPFDLRAHYARINSWPWAILNVDQWGLQLEI